MLAGAFDRLAVRLAMGITLLVLIPLAAVLHTLSSHHYDRTIELRRQAAEGQNRVLEATLRHQMLERDTTLITTILDDIGSRPEVSNAMILDHDGAVRFSSRKELIGTVISRESPTCLVCHAKEPAHREDWVLLGASGNDALRSVLPIANTTECHGCHAPEDALNGILILDVSLDDVRAKLEQDVLWLTAGAAGLGLIVLLGMAVLVHRLVFVRLNRLRRTARAIATGHLEDRAEVSGRDMVSSVAEDFNLMADSVSRLIKEVRAQEAQLIGVMNGLDDGLVVLDRDLRVIASNHSFCRKVGKHAEVLRGRQCGSQADLALPCCDSGSECPARRCLETGEVQRAVFKIASGSGEAGIVQEVHASPVYDGSGRVVQVVELWRDISERVREVERLAEIERLVALGVLASGFSHEVNTPLGSMLICAETVLASIDETAEPSDLGAAQAAVRENVETIRQEVHRCRRITEQFLRFSRGVPPSIEPIDLRRVVKRVVGLVSPTAREAQATIRLEEDDKLPVVRANTEVVQHVILNLLVNAIQSLNGPTRRITLSFRTGDDVRIRIEDTGCGIPPAARKPLFEPFRSGKPQGTGLGLFLSRRLMRRFDGDVRLVHSEEGVGSCFEIIFLKAVEGEP
jgi:PAS domain S-box-containing protein